MKKLLKNIWKDPVWSKVIAIGIITLIIYFNKNLIQNISIVEYILIFVLVLILIIFYLIKGQKSRPKFEYNEEHKRLDKELLKKVKDELLPSEGSISFIRTFNFAGWAFHNEYLKDLREFSYYIEKPEFEFINDELNRLLENLKINISKFLSIVGLNTWRLKSLKIDANTVPPEWEDEQPDRFRKVVEEIHATAEKICENYDKLIKLGRRKLGI